MARASYQRIDNIRLGVAKQHREAIPGSPKRIEPKLPKKSVKKPVVAHPSTFTPSVRVHKPLLTIHR
jgi:hypothetical protein